MTTTCPLCGPAQPMEHDAECDDFACPECGLCAPADEVERLEIRLARVEVLEAEVARLKQPEVVLAEAERLLREAVGLAAVYGAEVYLSANGCTSIYGEAGNVDGHHGDSLAEAYAAITRGLDG